jgi:hypothetical protein
MPRQEYQSFAGYGDGLVYVQPAMITSPSIWRPLCHALHLFLKASHHRLDFQGMDDLLCQVYDSMPKYEYTNRLHSLALYQPHGSA